VRAQVNEETNKGQLPWGHTNLIGSVYLNPSKAAATEAPNTPAPTTTAASDVELEFWRSIKDSNKVEELNAYLSNYPNGVFKAIALARIAKLQGGDTDATRNLTVDTSSVQDEAEQVSEDKIGLDRGQRRDAQRRLTKLGFDVNVTGKFDEPTRGVIKRWQAARGYPATGYLNKAQHTALIGEQFAARTADEDSASSSSSDESSTSRHSRHSSGGGGRRYGRGGGGPGGFIGHMVGGLFR